MDPAAFTVFFKDPDGTSAAVKVAEVAFVDFTLDIMLLLIQQPMAGRSPLQIRVEPMSSGGITSIHHANLGPKQISALGGTMLANDGQQATYLLASAPGATGAPVFDREWRVVATHSARIKHRISGLEAPIDARIGTTSPAMIDAVRQAAAGERLWRRIAAAQRSLRSIDVDLTSAELWPAGTRSRPVVIELVDEETPLPAIEGLTVTARTGRIASAAATRPAINTLAETAGVISIEASRAAGQSECVRSVPYIGAPIVHQKYGEIGDMALIALIDSGIDVGHAAFRDERGRSRIVAFWDQQDPRSSAAQPATTISAEARAMAERIPLHGGALYVREDIEKMIAGAPAPATFPSALASTHGTLVASIAAGRRTGDDANDFPGGVAPGAQVIAVRYDLDGESVGNSNGHVQALNFIDALALALERPVVVNISNGMNSGAHDGSSKVEGACGDFTGQGRKPGRVVVKAAGNELNMARHATFTVGQGFKKTLRWQSRPIPDAVNPKSLIERIELWFPRSNRYEFQARTPEGGLSSPMSTEFQKLDEFLPNGNRLVARYWLMRPENARSLLELSITKGNSAAVESGQWALEIVAVERPQAEPIHAWIEVISNRDIRFLDDPDNSYTITIPGTSEHVITVGAIEPIANPYPFENSSRGPTITKLPKPELVAPGVRVRGAGAGSGTKVAVKASDGTSLSAPHVAGVLALVMSARKKKETRGAAMFNSIVLRAGLLDHLKNFTYEPDPQTGYGSLDAAAFFEFMDEQD
jgi:endonuclease G